MKKIFGMGRGGKAKKKAPSKKILAAGLCLCLAAGIAVVVVIRAADRTYRGPAFNGKIPAGSVNGEFFFQEDLDVYAAELRAAIAIDYGRRYGLSGMGEKFWDTKFDGVTPRESLYRYALRDLTRNMITLQEARARGIDAPKRYNDLEAERADRNASGDEIKYGPETLGPAEFTSYRITGIIGELKTILLQKELAPTEEQLRAAYAMLPSELKYAPNEAKAALFRWNNAALNTEIRNALRKIFNRGADPEEALHILKESYPGLVLTMDDYDFDSRYISKEDPVEQELAGAIARASRGSLVPAPGDEPKVYYIIQKEGGRLMSFEEAPGLGRNKWINDQFELFLDKKVKKAKIKLYEPNPQRVLNPIANEHNRKP